MVGSLRKEQTNRAGIRSVVLLIAACSLASAAQAPAQARNVILFLGDAGGIATLHAASVYAHNDSQKLFIHSMPHIGLSDTSPAKEWVTDSAAGMTAIVTGVKTDNGVVSMTPSGAAQRVPLKTILEYAEERGLSTGVISNMPITDATPAACYAHAASRKNTAEIFGQLLEPRFGDGVDVVIGAGRRQILEATAMTWSDLRGRLTKARYKVLESLPDASPGDKRVIALFDTADFSPTEAIDSAVAVLSRNPKGYFLMLEWDMHASKTKIGLDRVVAMDETIRRTAAKVGPDTLVLFTADHSYDLRLRSGKRGEPILPEEVPATSGETPQKAPRPRLRVEDGHTGEQVIVAAQGPGAERVRGFLRNTDLFHIMMKAYGWPYEVTPSGE